LTPERRPGTGARLARTPATAGLVGALGVPLLYMLVVDPVVVAGALGGTGRALVGYAVWWTLAGALLVVTVFAEGRPLASIGVRRLSLRLLGLAAGLGLALSLFVPLVTVTVDALGVGGSGGVADVAAQTVWWVLAVGVVTAAVTEEVVVRGYVIERLLERTGRRWLSGGVSLAVFVAIHLPGWSLAHVLGVVVPLGAALTVAYLWTRNLPFVIVAHLVVNAPLVALALAG
jgi:uncharacterized protein